MPTTPVFEGDYEGYENYPIIGTKTYFTTSTYYTTYIDRSATVTKTRTNIESRIETQTVNGGLYDYLPGPDLESAQAPLLTIDPQQKYLSLGPNIYGLVKTFLATYTYLTTNRQV